MSATVVTPCRRIRGRLRVPGDKSISHRYALLGALARGETRIERFAPGADCAATLACLRGLGVEIAEERPADPDAAPAVRLAGRGLRGLRQPSGPLDAANSGTTMRLLAGMLAAHPFDATLVGDASLSRRPMGRVIEPLGRMGARIDSAGGRPPLTVRGAELSGLDYELPVPSAQVKSAILLAGLQANGEVVVHERVPTRDHTERALAAFGAAVGRRERAVVLRGPQPLTGRSLRVPGDISSATFWAAAAAALPGSDVEIVDVGLNPTRTAILDVLRRAGAHVEVTVDGEEAGEPVGRLRVAHGRLVPLAIAPEEVAALIDEVPALAAFAALGAGMCISGASELRAKESDRISALVAGFRAMGAAADEAPDGFVIHAGTRLRGGSPDAAGDHRLAMAFAIAALGAAEPTTIGDSSAVAVSYPGFFDALHELSGEDG